MGGDGGVVATNRKYMRGAGSACHTADSKRSSTSATITEAEQMTTCAITGNVLNYNEDIVACPYGRLYGKEAAVKALLRRLENGGGIGGNGNGNVDLGWHVRGLKDLKPVRFALSTNSNHTGKDEKTRFPICPVTSIELNGLQPAFVIVKKKLKKKKDKNKGKSNDEAEDENQPNVLSEKAIKTMGIEALQEEYGPFEQDDLIRLAPPSGRILDEIKLKLQEKRSSDEEADNHKSSKKKRKLQGRNDDNLPEQSIIAAADPSSLNANVDANTSTKKVKTNTTATATKNSTATNLRTINDVRNSVAATVASSEALSSLFGDTKKPNLSDKQKKDNLFVCNC